MRSNKIATLFGREDFRQYINKQVQNGNMVRIKNKSGKSSEGDALIAPAYRNTTLNKSISKNGENVNEKFSVASEAFSQKLAELNGAYYIIFLPPISLEV